MGDTIIVTESSPASPTTPPPVSPATPPETEHNEAVQFGVMIAQQNQILANLATLSERVTTLEGAQEASRVALSAVVDTVEDVAEVVEEIVTEPTEDDMPVPPPAPADDEPEDTPPGKTHWFRRSGREWAGK